MAQQLSDVVKAVIALSTRAGTECVAHALQSLTDENLSMMVKSIDGIGAFDLISCKVMLQVLMHIKGGPVVMPFFRMFYKQASTHLGR